MWQIIMSVQGISRSSTWPKQVPETQQTSKDMETSHSTLHVPTGINTGDIVKSINDSHTYERLGRGEG